MDHRRGFLSRLAGPALLGVSRTLPLEHGFPLRLAARDHPGLEWIRYAHRIEVLHA